jgi:hypothetical protein
MEICELKKFVFAFTWCQSEIHRDLARLGTRCHVYQELCRSPFYRLYSRAHGAVAALSSLTRSFTIASWLHSAPTTHRHAYVDTWNAIVRGRGYVAGSVQTNESQVCGEAGPRLGGEKNRRRIHKTLISEALLLGNWQDLSVGQRTMVQEERCVCEELRSLHRPRLSPRLA